MEDGIVFDPRQDLLERSLLVMAREYKWRSRVWSTSAGWGGGGAGRSPGDTAESGAVTAESRGEGGGTGQREETGPGMVCSPRQMGERKSRRSAGTPGCAGGPVAMNGSMA